MKHTIIPVVGRVHTKICQSGDIIHAYARMVHTKLYTEIGTLQKCAH